MTDVESFALIILVTAAAAILAVLSNRISARSRIPAPAIFLLAAATASDIWPDLGRLSITSIERIVTVALAVILFDGGMHIGRHRFREAAGTVTWLGVAGTFTTAAGVAMAAHWLFGLGWREALLLGTALSPTDPAVVFSVLGTRRIAGRSGTILEGESGANDPVGIALLVALVGTGATGGGAVMHVAVTFVEQMVIGAAVGAAGAWLLLQFIRRVPLPSEGLYSLRVLAGALFLYGLATVAHGSGFLAVFVAGILLGDERAPYKSEIERFHSSLASLAEIVAFVVLGLSIHVGSLDDDNAWLVGLVLAVLLAVVIRPVLSMLLLLPVRLTHGERLFIGWSGLKGAVPILLGTIILSAGGPEAVRTYHVIFIVVAFSVIVQGGLLPAVAARCGIPMETVDPEPWAVGVRLRDEPEGVRRYIIEPGVPADGAVLRELPLGESAWVFMIIRHGQIIPTAGGAQLLAGDEVLLLVDPEHPTDVEPLFVRPDRSRRPRND